MEISVSFSPALRQLQIRFRDQGKAFDPLHTETPDVTKPLTRRKIGGLGLFMVKKMMDKLEYQRLDGCNILTLTKNCTGEGK